MKIETLENSGKGMKLDIVRRSDRARFFHEDNAEAQRIELLEKEGSPDRKKKSVSQAAFPIPLSAKEKTEPSSVFSAGKKTTGAMQDVAAVFTPAKTEDAEDPNNAAAEQMKSSAGAAAGALQSRMRDAIGEKIKRARGAVSSPSSPLSGTGYYMPGGNSNPVNAVLSSYERAKASNVPSAMSRSSRFVTKEGVDAASKAGAAATANTAGTAAGAAGGAAAGAASGGATLAAQAAVEATTRSVKVTTDAVQSSIASHTRSLSENGNGKKSHGLILGIAAFFLSFVLLFTGTTFAASNGHAKNLNARVEGYRASITKWATEYGIPEYVEVLLALCMAESGVLENPGDPFQCSESGYAVKQPNGITDPEYSIEIGVYIFSRMIDKSGCTSPNDRNGLFLALQGYNMGPGFITFCKQNYNGIWSVEAATAYSQKMGHGGVFGNPHYIDQFLKFYEFGSVALGGTSGTQNPQGLIKPVEKYSISTPFGGYAGHKGADFAMPVGTPVYAAADGVVTRAYTKDSWGYSWGYHIKINHRKNCDTLYAHLSRVLVQEGQQVRQGDLIGYSGNTGNTTGPHLHFELYLYNNRVDPAPYIDTPLLSQVFNKEVSV